MDRDGSERTPADEERFRALFATAYPALCRYGFLRGLPPADVEDLVADVLAIAWRRLDVVPVEDPRPWLFAVARNVWRNQLRSAARLDGIVARVADAGVTYPVEPPSEPSLEAVRRAMAALSEDDHEILRLVGWDGLTPAQAAVALGCTSTAARVRLHRARARLARRLNTDPDGERRSKEVSHGQGNER
jgi:RNA polymerase sigma-70 factor, ECF subfamily